MQFKLSQWKTNKPTRAATVEKMGRHGIGTTAKVLSEGSTPESRKALAAKLGCTPAEVLEVVNRADLSRVKGIGPVFSDLLEEAGVDTVVELSKRVPANLHATLLEKAANHHTKRMPRLGEVQNWVAQAKLLGRNITY